MYQKRFTLIELVISIVVISILASIVLIKVTDFKKQAITSSMKSNIKVLQLASDLYFLDNNSYPVTNKENLTLESPQLIDVQLLTKDGYLKKELDTKKIKEQYYWVDVFGAVWGATKQPKNNINLVKKENGSYSMEVVATKEFKSLDVYETLGYNSLANSLEKEDLFADLKAQINKFYRVIDTIETKVKRDEIVRFELPNKDSNYLISMIDEYGLETAPMGKFNNSLSPRPVYRGEGKYTFEISGEETMYWEDFITLEDKPEGTSITFRFRVIDEDGELMEWTEDFFSLPPSKKIIVETELKGDGKGAYPTLYDLNVVYHYENEEIVKKEEPKCKEDCYKENASCPQPNHGGTFSYRDSKRYNGQIGTTVSQFYLGAEVTQSISDVIMLEPRIADSYKILSATYYVHNGLEYIEEKDLNKEYLDKCAYVVYEIEIIKPTDTTEEERFVCGSGGSISKYYGNDKKIVYTFIIKEETHVKSIDIKNLGSNIHVKNVYIEQSTNGAPYEIIDSILDIKPNSCIHIVYEFEYIVKDGPKGNPPEPKVTTCKGKDCVPPACKNCVSIGEKCLTKCGVSGGGSGVGECLLDDCIQVTGCEEGFSSCKPNPPCIEDCTPVSIDPEWETVEQVRFFAHGPTDRSVRWHTVTTDETILDKNTRIVYNYAKGSRGGGWSNLYEDFSTTGIASSVMAVAFIQVRISEINNVTVDKYPLINSIIFENELGDLPASMTNPSLTIIAEKDNNEGREVYSTESNIKWDVISADPRNLKITKVEWEGDVRSKYEAGEYIIKAKVTNERGYSSQWVEFPLIIKEEKPVAVITLKSSSSSKYINTSDKLAFSLSSSYDPDGDKIINYEWENKKETYPIGTHEVRLRVQDDEGYWSDWTVYEVYIGDISYNVARIEGESKDENEVSQSDGSVTNGEKYSNGAARHLTGSSYSTVFTFEGVGFDIMIFSNKAKIHIDGEKTPINVSPGLHSYRNLKEGVHKVEVTPYTSGDANAIQIDYIDVFSTDDKASILKTYSKVITGTKESVNENTSFSSLLDQKIRLYFDLDKNAKMDILIVDKNENEVKKLYSSNSLGGSYKSKTIEWDGHSNDGKTVANGDYYFKFDLVGVNGTKNSYKYKVSLLNTPPIYRIEGETKDSSEVYSRSDSTRTDSKYSNGSAKHITGLATPATYYFNGTGFDVMIYNKQANMYLDGSTTPIKLNVGLNSFRDLELTNHEVRINPVLSGDANAIQIDYLDIYSSNDTSEVSIFDVKLLNDSVESTTKQTTLNRSLNQALRLYYKLNKNADTVITIVDEKDNLVRNLDSSSQLGGSYKDKMIEWDGIDNFGNIAANGDYYFKFDLTGVYGSKSTSKFKISLNSNQYFKRIESESTDKTEVVTSARGSTKGTKFSNGEAIHLTGSSAHVTFTFEGNGFDIMIYNKQANMYLDNGSVIKLNVGLNSFRNLDYGQHTVRVTPTTSGDANAIQVDYLNVYK